MVTNLEKMMYFHIIFGRRTNQTNNKITTPAMVLVYLTSSKLLKLHQSYLTALKLPMPPKVT